MKVLTCTGFYGTGSSAITDIFRDCENVECRGEYEVRILHDPYGVSDLEYNLVENPNRHNTSNAIKKFKWNVDFLSGTWWNKRYENYFGGQFKNLSYEYIDEICEFTYLGKWHWDIIERGKIFWFLCRSYNKLCTIIKKIFHINNEVSHNFLPKNELAYAGTFSEEKFLKATRKYTRALLNSINRENKEFIMVDQLVPPSNLDRYNRYVDNLKTIVVDRDPRDVFLLEKYCYHGSVVPWYDVDVFCKWYKWTRAQFENSKQCENVLRVQFEDLIYHTEETISRLLDFAEIDPKNYHMKHFNPNLSIKNTKLWEKYSDDMELMQVIQKKLSSYCYKY